MNFFSYLLDPANWAGDGGITHLLLQHLAYAVVSVAIAAVVAIPLGTLIGHTGRGNLIVIGLGNAARAVPTLGLIVLIVLVFGTGLPPIIVVLVVLAIPPILTATAAGVAGADSGAVHAARAVGMTEGQIVAKVEWPLALPLVISGLRSASLQVVATATVAAYVTLGGLGRLIIDGIGLREFPRAFAGAILVGVLAIVIDVVLGGIGWLTVRRTRPRRHRRTKQTQVAPA